MVCKIMTEFCGYAVIVVIDKYESKKKREGAKLDGKKAERAFSLLGFETAVVEDKEEEVKEDNTITTDRFKEELLKSIEHVKTNGYSNFAVMISTHGGERNEGDGNYEDMLCFYDKPMSTKKAIMDVLDKEIPKINKLVLVQACRGREGAEHEEKEDRGVEIKLVDEIEDEYDTNDPKPSPTQPPVPTTKGHCLVPCIQNCVTMFASPSGFSAYRSKQQGSYLPDCFLKAVQSLRKGETVNIVHLLHTVNRLMTTKIIELKYNPGNTYLVTNLGSIVHSLTTPFLCTKRKD